MPRRYCNDCGKRIDLTPLLSNMKAPNGHTLQIYRCDNCSTKEKCDVVIAILRKKLPTKNFYRDIRTEIYKST